MTDLLLIETGSGGDLVLAGSDLVGISGLENQPYLAQFSGDGNNWINALLISDPVIQFSSTTEQALKDNPLSSAGRVNIQNAMLADLQYLTADGTTVSVTATITKPNRLDVAININGKLFYYQWNPYIGFLKYSI